MRREAVYKKDGREREPKTAYLMSSLGPEQATSERQLALNRGYWAIENRVHYVWYRWMRTGPAAPHKDALPRVLTTLANLAVSILRSAGVNNIQNMMDLLHGDCQGTTM